LSRFKFLILPCLLFLIQLNMAQGQMVFSFEKKIKEKCPSIITIQVKKALLEIIKTTEIHCEGPFIKSVINNCGKLTCQELYSFYEDAKNENSGNVIGNSKIGEN